MKNVSVTNRQFPEMGQDEPIIHVIEHTDALEPQWVYKSLFVFLHILTSRYWQISFYWTVFMAITGSVPTWTRLVPSVEDP